MPDKTVLRIETVGDIDNHGLILLSDLRNFVDRAERNGISPDCRILASMYSPNHDWLTEVWAERDLEQI